MRLGSPPNWKPSKIFLKSSVAFFKFCRSNKKSGLKLLKMTDIKNFETSNLVRQTWCYIEHWKEHRATIMSTCLSLCTLILAHKTLWRLTQTKTISNAQAPFCAIWILLILILIALKIQVTTLKWDCFIIETLNLKPQKCQKINCRITYALT